MSGHRLPSLLLSLLLISACRADQSGSGPPALRERWTIAQIHCPLGCSPAVRAFLQAQIGKPVLLGERRFQAPFVDACDGDIRLERRQRATAEMLRELSQGAAPGRVLDASSLRLSASSVSSALVYCRAGMGPELPLARLPVVEAARVFLQFEEQSLVELQPAINQ
jgi:hypothetical protein